jgi:chromosome segregation ATPase
VRAQTPQEVLEAVRRLEDDLQTIRTRARERERDMDSLRVALAQDAARERRALVEDMERLVDLIGTSWRSTHDQIAELTAEVRHLRNFAETTADMLRGASVELHLGGPVNGLHEAPLG